MRGKRFLTILGLMIPMLFMLGSLIPAQDFTQLLEAVDKLDNSLKQLVAEEKAERVKSIKALKSQIESLRHGQKNQVVSNDLATPGPVEINRLNKNDQKNAQSIKSLWKEINRLNEELAHLQASQSTDLAVPGPVAINLRNQTSHTESDLPELEISGFFDATGTYSTLDDDETNFGINQAEIDLEHELSDKATAFAAIAYNGDDGGFELAVATIDLTLYSGEQFVSSLNVVAGQFDVPFGIDYNVYGAPDRKLVTSPQATDETHGGWNDFGFQFTMDTKAGNLTLFAVNGFEETTEVLDEAASLSAGYDVFEEIETTPAFAFGTRLGFTPFSFLEIGGSFAAGLDDANENQLQLYGTDLQFSMYNFDLKGEFVLHSHNRTFSEENSRAYYFQGTYNILDKAFVTSRYGSFRDEGAEWNGRFSFGAGYALAGGVELRFEAMVTEESAQNANIIQMVAGF